MKTRTAFLCLLLAAVWTKAPGAPVPTSSGEAIYVPAYPSIFFHDKRRTIDLAVTLSIHNVDPDHPIQLTKAAYYDTSGKFIRNELDKPQQLAPFETRNIVVERSDTSGGPGANFVVEWHAATPVVAPLVEAVMINLNASQSVSFTTQGKVIKEFGEGN